MKMYIKSPDEEQWHELDGEVHEAQFSTEPPGQSYSLQQPTKATFTCTIPNQSLTKEMRALFRLTLPRIPRKGKKRTKKVMARLGRDCKKVSRYDMLSYYLYYFSENINPSWLKRAGFTATKREP